MKKLLLKKQRLLRHLQNKTMKNKEGEKVVRLKKLFWLVLILSTVSFFEIGAADGEPTGETLAERAAEELKEQEAAEAAQRAKGGEPTSPTTTIPKKGTSGTSSSGEPSGVVQPVNPRSGSGPVVVDPGTGTQTIINPADAAAIAAAAKGGNPDLNPSLPGTSTGSDTVNPRLEATVDAQVAALGASPTADAVQKEESQVEALDATATGATKSFLDSIIATLKSLFSSAESKQTGGDTTGSTTTPTDSKSSGNFLSRWWKSFTDTRAANVVMQDVRVTADLASFRNDTTTVAQQTALVQNIVSQFRAGATMQDIYENTLTSKTGQPGYVALDNPAKEEVFKELIVDVYRSLIKEARTTDAMDQTTKSNPQQDITTFTKTLVQSVMSSSLALRDLENLPTGSLDLQGVVQNIVVRLRNGTSLQDTFMNVMPEGTKLTVDQEQAYKQLIADTYNVLKESEQNPFKQPDTITQEDLAQLTKSLVTTVMDSQPDSAIYAKAVFLGDSIAQQNLVKAIIDGFRGSSLTGLALVHEVFTSSLPEGTVLTLDQQLSYQFVIQEVYEALIDPQKTPFNFERPQQLDSATLAAMIRPVADVVNNSPKCVADLARLAGIATINATTLVQTIVQGFRDQKTLNDVLTSALPTYNMLTVDQEQAYRDLIFDTYQVLIDITNSDIFNIPEPIEISTGDRSAFTQPLPTAVRQVLLTTASGLDLSNVSDLMITAMINGFRQGGGVREVADVVDQMQYGGKSPQVTGQPYQESPNLDLARDVLEVLLDPISSRIAGSLSDQSLELIGAQGKAEQAQVEQEQADAQAKLAALQEQEAEAQAQLLAAQKAAQSSTTESAIAADQVAVASAAQDVAAQESIVAGVEQQVAQGQAVQEDVTKALKKRKKKQSIIIDVDPLTKASGTDSSSSSTTFKASSASGTPEPSSPATSTDSGAASVTPSALDKAKQVLSNLSSKASSAIEALQQALASDPVAVEDALEPKKIIRKTFTDDSAKQAYAKDFTTNLQSSLTLPKGATSADVATIVSQLMGGKSPSDVLFQYKSKTQVSGMVTTVDGEQVPGKVVDSTLQTAYKEFISDIWMQMNDPRNNLITTSSTYTANLAQACGWQMGMNDLQVTLLGDMFIRALGGTTLDATGSTLLMLDLAPSVQGATTAAGLSAFIRTNKLSLTSLKDLGLSLGTYLTGRSDQNQDQLWVIIYRDWLKEPADKTRQGLLEQVYQTVQPQPAKQTALTDKGTVPTKTSLGGSLFNSLAAKAKQAASDLAAKVKGSGSGASSSTVTPVPVPAKK